jgi:transcriptional regulator with XRE-family HTH domain
VSGNFTLRQLIARSGKTTSEIAQAVGVNPSTVRHWMRGLHAPHPSAARLMAAELGVSLEQVMSACAESATCRLSD